MGLVNEQTMFEINGNYFREEYEAILIGFFGIEKILIPKKAKLIDKSDTANIDSGSRWW